MSQTGYDIEVYPMSSLPLDWDLLNSSGNGQHNFWETDPLASPDDPEPEVVELQIEAKEPEQGLMESDPAMLEFEPESYKRPEYAELTADNGLLSSPGSASSSHTYFNRISPSWNGGHNAANKYNGKHAMDANIEQSRLQLIQSLRFLCYRIEINENVERQTEKMVTLVGVDDYGHFYRICAAVSIQYDDENHYYTEYDLYLAEKYNTIKRPSQGSSKDIFRWAEDIVQYDCKHSIWQNHSPITETIVGWRELKPEIVTRSDGKKTTRGQWVAVDTAQTTFPVYEYKTDSSYHYKFYSTQALMDKGPRIVEGVAKRYRIAQACLREVTIPHPNEVDITGISIATAREQAEVLRIKDGGKAAKRKAKQKQIALEQRKNKGSKDSAKHENNIKAGRISKKRKT